MAVEGNGGGDGVGHWGVEGGSVRAAEVADVAAHEDEGVGHRAREAGYVSDGVAWDVEDVEAAVSEEVVGWECADFGVGGEGDFVHGAAFVVGVEDRAVLGGGVAGHEVLLEARAHV